MVNLAADARSILSLYKALIRLRKERSPLVTGSYVPVVAESDLLLYRQTLVPVGDLAPVRRAGGGFLRRRR